jgi:hypothetical protein
MFATVHGKWKHTQYVTCEAKNMNHIIMNNNITNITNNTINNTFNVSLDFGKEDLSGLISEENYQERMCENIEARKYAITNSVTDIFFNDKYPCNQTIKKTRKNDNLVTVKVNGKWEKRLSEDIQKTLMNKIENYHVPYFVILKDKYQEDDEESILFKRKTRHVKEFGHVMLWYGWKGKTIRDIGVLLNEPEDETEMNKMRRNLKALVHEKLYDMSKQLKIKPH